MFLLAGAGWRLQHALHSEYYKAVIILDAGSAPHPQHCLSCGEFLFEHNCRLDAAGSARYHQDAD